MAAMNDFKVIGHLCADIEVLTSAKGNEWCKFRVGITRKRGDGEEYQTVFLDIKAFGFTAEMLRGLTKGQAVLALGEYCLDEWEDKDGNKRSKPYLKAYRAYPVVKNAAVAKANVYGDAGEATPF